jgi:hypothetical protein
MRLEGLVGELNKLAESWKVDDQPL